MGKDFPDILRRIVEDRRKRLSKSGYDQGFDLPQKRLYPVQPFPEPVIGEIKRRSPSRGALGEIDDPVELADRYVSAGVGAISVLTEEAYFGGSLRDLMVVKKAHPEIAVLRKDFLLSGEDIDISWRAGADAVLLIAAILDDRTLRELHDRAGELGLAALVEVHDREELERARPFAPSVIGINSRDLRTFLVDAMTPLELGDFVDWPATVVFESGIHYREDAFLARSGRFDSILVGEALVRDPERLPELLHAMSGDDTSEFWTTLARRRRMHNDRIDDRNRLRPLVKICGITNGDDARTAVDYGADLLGLVYAESPRKAPEGLARHLADLTDIPRVGVVVETAEDRTLLERAQRDLSDGYLTALQLHGDSDPVVGSTFGLPYYRAIRPSSAEELEDGLSTARSPRVLVDAYHPTVYGGSGRPVPADVLDGVDHILHDTGRGRLWLAGGLGPDNVGEAVKRYKPELVDASSRLETEPGRKDHGALQRFFQVVNNEK